ncbi:hypothetical protein OK016_20990 [Vibrio chagasii]|nr:hypothetical protein [Vibrio chagasii]
MQIGLKQPLFIPENLVIQRVRAALTVSPFYQANQRQALAAYRISTLWAKPTLCLAVLSAR